MKARDAELTRASSADLAPAPKLPSPLLVLHEFMPLPLAERLYQFLNVEMPSSWWGLWEGNIGSDHVRCRFRRAGENHYPTCNCPVCDALRFIRSDKFCSLLSEVCGLGTLKGATLFASQYIEGDWCETHTDRGNGDVAFVWNLSKDWRAEYGGALQVFDVDSTIVPTFNTLVLFGTFGDGRAHQVTRVTVASPKRLAVAGWYSFVGGQ